METLIQKTPDCPVCGNPTVPIRPNSFHCGKVVLLIQAGDHYLTFTKLAKELQGKGCPICGEPMQKAGRFKWPFSTKEEGLPRMHCDQPDHYCYVTEAWYQLNKR